MNRTKKTLATLAFTTGIFGLKYWLGFETMLMIVMCAWFTTIIDK